MSIMLPDGGIRYDSMGDSMRFVLTAADTDGQYTLIEDSLKPGFDAALHLHRQHSESFYILAGNVSFTLGSQQVVATPGATIYIPPGLPHAARSSEPGKMLTIFSPGGLEGAMAAFGQLTPEAARSPGAIQQIMDAYDIVDLAQPPLAGLVQFYDLLLAGDAEALLALFGAEPLLDTPLTGAVAGPAAVRAFVANQQVWLHNWQAQPRCTNMLVTNERVVLEYVIDLLHNGVAIDLPVALVADRAGSQCTAIRAYHSTWPLTGGHIVRPPLLPLPSVPLAEPAMIKAYMAALEQPDQAALLALFSADGYVREPSGERYRHAGSAGRQRFYAMALATGGVVLHHCSATFDGACFAVEYVCDRWGNTALLPQAGMAVYRLAGNGQVQAVRIYDDISPPGAE